MGHRQEMTQEQRRKFDAFKYQRAKEEKRGHNYAYYSDELIKELENKGYKQHRFLNGNSSTRSENTAVGDVMEFRRKGYYARIICIPNKLRIKEYIVYYKEK